MTVLVLLSTLQAYEQDMLIKRTFKAGSITAGGKAHNSNTQEVKEFYNNELYWLTKLDSKWLPKLIDFDDTTQTIVQQYYGLCLLDYLHTDLYERIQILRKNK